MFCEWLSFFTLLSWATSKTHFPQERWTYFYLINLCSITFHTHKQTSHSKHLLYITPPLQNLQRVGNESISPAVWSVAQPFVGLVESQGSSLQRQANAAACIMTCESVSQSLHRPRILKLLWTYWSHFQIKISCKSSTFGVNWSDVPTFDL